MTLNNKPSNLFGQQTPKLWTTTKKAQELRHQPLSQNECQPMVIFFGQVQIARQSSDRESVKTERHTETGRQR